MTDSPDTPTAPDELDDGFGNRWETCGPECDLHIVRPGKVQCSGRACGMDDNGTWGLLEELSDP